MVKLKNNKGISLITLSVAIIVLVTITSMLVYNAHDGVEIRKLQYLYNDIESLSDKVSNYYVKYADIPIVGDVVYADETSEFVQNAQSMLNPNDGNEYYILDLKSLEGVTLNYGEEYELVDTTSDISSLTDIYIINKQSHTIYYPKGITVEDITYYTDKTEYTEVELVDIP